MTADIPSVLSKDGIDGLGAVPSVLEESRTGRLTTLIAASPLYSPLALESLLESLLDSLLDSLLGSLLERAVLDKAALRDE